VAGGTAATAGMATVMVGSVASQVVPLVKHWLDERKKRKAEESAAKKKAAQDRMDAFGDSIKVEVPSEPDADAALPPISDESVCLKWTDEDGKERACTKGYKTLGTLKYLGAIKATLEDGRTWEREA
jgi:hypothetical protein